MTNASVESYRYNPYCNFPDSIIIEMIQEMKVTSNSLKLQIEQQLQRDSDSGIHVGQSTNTNFLRKMHTNACRSIQSYISELESRDYRYVETVETVPEPTLEREFALQVQSMRRSHLHILNNHRFKPTRTKVWKNKRNYHSLKFNN
jgi:hypothetical protein